MGAMKIMTSCSNCMIVIVPRLMVEFQYVWALKLGTDGKILPI